jgi:hypothetical protein
LRVEQAAPPYRRYLSAQSISVDSKIFKRSNRLDTWKRYSVTRLQVADWRGTMKGRQ